MKLETPVRRVLAEQLRARSKEEEVETEGTNVKPVVKVELMETAGEWKNR